MILTAAINPVVPLNLLFPLQRVICPQSRQSAKYRIVPHNFTNDNLTNGKTLVITYRHVSVAHCLKQYILINDMFVEAFSPMIMKNKSVNFLMKSVETPQHFSISSSFIFNVLLRLY